MSQRRGPGCGDRGLTKKPWPRSSPLGPHRDGDCGKTVWSADQAGLVLERRPMRSGNGTWEGCWLELCSCPANAQPTLRPCGQPCQVSLSWPKSSVTIWACWAQDQSPGASRADGLFSGGAGVGARGLG